MTHVQNIVQNIWIFILRYWWVVLISIVAGAGYFFYLSQTTNAEDITEEYIVRSQTVRETISLSGSIDASERVTVAFPQSGRLTWVGVEEGDRVTQYQGLASLDQRRMEKDLQKRLNTFLTTRYNFDQSQDDNDEYPEEPDNEESDRMRRLIDIAQNNLDNAVLDVEIQALAKENAFLSSPIDGIVTRARHPYPGVDVSTSQVEFEIINPTSIYFAATADQVDVIKLENGMIGDISLDSFVDQEISGSIQNISFVPLQGEIGTSYEVEVTLGSLNYDKYRLGMTGDVTFTVDEFPDSLAIPSEYLQINEDGDTFVIRKTQEDEKTVLVNTPITIGDEYNGMILVQDGIRIGDVISLPREE